MAGPTRSNATRAADAQDARSGNQTHRSTPSGGYGAAQRRLITGTIAGLLVVTAIGYFVDQRDDGVRVNAGPSGPSVSVPLETDAVEPGPDSSGVVVATTTAPVTHAPPPVEQLEAVALRLEPTIKIPLLTGMVWNEPTARYYAITQDGKVFGVDRTLAASTVVLDLSAEVTPFERFSERGMLGIAFDPRDARMFLHFTDRDNQSHVVSYALVDGVPDVATRRNVLYVEQPGLGHKGGQLAFDGGGNLYIAFGDGGGSRGRDAQDMTKLLGAIVRIRPKLDADGYDIPDGNPYADTEGARPEIFAKGLRNPWRFSIDQPTGDIWIGDVGESDVEEVDLITGGSAGQNFGWYFKEGNSDYSDGAPDNLTGPVFEYRHDEHGPAVIGGYVYHGDSIAALQGAYVFADMSGPMFALGANRAGTRLNIANPTNGVITSFVVTPEQELLVVTQNEAIYRIVSA